MRQGWSIALVGVWLSGCSSPTVPTVPPVQEFVLEVGGSAAVSGTGLRVRFDRVLSDSRCPADAICITAGEGVVAVAIGRDGRPVENLSLRTDGVGRRAVVGDWALSLTKLDPYPLASHPTPLDDYKASFRVDPLAQPAGS
jgi:hypothetical protein